MDEVMKNSDIEEWLRPDESIEYQDMNCRITRAGDFVFAGSLFEAMQWQRSEQIHIINAKLNWMMAQMRGESTDLAIHPGARLRNSRTRQGMSLRAAAMFLDVTHVELGSIERGVTEWEEAAAMWVKWLRRGGDESNG